MSVRVEARLVEKMPPIPVPVGHNVSTSLDPTTFVNVKLLTISRTTEFNGDVNVWLILNATFLSMIHSLTDFSRM